AEPNHRPGRHVAQERIVDLEPQRGLLGVAEIFGYQLADGGDLEHSLPNFRWHAVIEPDRLLGNVGGFCNLFLRKPEKVPGSLDVHLSGTGSEEAKQVLLRDGLEKSL